MWHEPVPYPVPCEHTPQSESEVPAGPQKTVFVTGSKLFTHMVSAKGVLLVFYYWLRFSKRARSWV